MERFQITETEAYKGKEIRPAMLTVGDAASRAVKDLFDLLGETDEEILFFCIHDADAADTKIYETLQVATTVRPAEGFASLT